MPAGEAVRYNRTLMPEEILIVHSRAAERVKRGQTVQHVLGALLLASAAFGHLQSLHGRGIVLPALEIAASAALIIAAIREKVRHARGAGHEKVAWIELAGAAMGFVEAAHRVQERAHHHLSFLVLSFVPPFILLAFAFFDTRVWSKRYLKLDDDGFEIRLRRWKRRIGWSDVRSFRMREKAVEFTMQNGRNRTFKLRDVKECDQAMAWLEERLRLRGIAESATP
ncbi:MAG: hypothetical protein QOK37_4299 [Thermoanaerobaculia bacterium]|nr:hypothetical protein [Thermoanaerobaculia bacterium]